MTSFIRILAALITTAVLSGCAGTNFKQPDPQSMVVGKSTTADVTRAMGEPRQVGEALKNGQKVKTMHYAYAEGAGTGRYPGVTPARAMVFTAFNDVLVGQEFLSSFPQDATEFDESKVPSIAKGKTTRAEVLTVLGKPNGEAIYPVIKKQDEKAIVYSYSHVRGTVFNLKFYSKTLLISFGSNDVVSDVEFATTGEK